MGKVIRNFIHGWVGSISRSNDDIVVAIPNRSTGVLDFGKPVALSDDKLGVVPFDPTRHTAADFVGVSVRTPSKTPDTYGSKLGSYASGELADILVRGSIIVACANTAAAIGDSVSILKTTGGFTVGSGENFVALNNVHISGAHDGTGNVEIIINMRNKL